MHTPPDHSHEACRYPQLAQFESADKALRAAIGECVAPFLKRSLKIGHTLPARRSRSRVRLAERALFMPLCGG